MSRKAIFALAVVMGCGADTVAVTPDAAPVGPVVRGDFGAVRGTNDRGAIVYWGIPFAEPPLGALRWAPPRPAAPWTDVRDATQRPPACPQLPGAPPLPASEDCLTLSVWTPDPAPVNAPVMVWIHGGALAAGSSREKVYDGPRLTAAGVILVSINYRLGPLGFLAHPALTAADPARPASGNYGFLDQRLALAWVHDNIAAFGGDPTRVTVFGESAGGVSVCVQALLPESNRYFRGVIAESGICGLANTPLATAEAAGQHFAARVGCGDGAGADTLACLRGKSADELVAGIPDKAVGWGPVKDGVFLSEDTLALVSNLSGLKMIVGANAEDGQLFAARDHVADGAAYEALVRDEFAGAADQVLTAYPLSAYANPTAAWGAVLTDGNFRCPAFLGGVSGAQAGIPVYLYHFVKKVTSPFYPEPGAFHTAELEFVFAGEPHPFVGGLGPFAPFAERHDADDLALSDLLVAYWTRFAATGDPNAEGLPAWPRFDMGGGYLEIGTPTVGKTDTFLTDQCAVWLGIFFGGRVSQPGR